MFASRPRRALGPDADTLATSGNGYFVRIDEERLDAARFERALASGEDALRRQEFSLAESVLGEALSFWRGPALADLEDEPFVHSESGRLAELRLRALEAKLEASLELGRHGEAVAELESLGSRSPLRERVRSLLMIALYHSGRQARLSRSS